MAVMKQTCSYKFHTFVSRSNILTIIEVVSFKTNSLSYVQLNSIKVMKE
jgi:hypothetical protein